MRGHFKVRLKLAGGEEEQVPRRKPQVARRKKPGTGRKARGT